MMDKKQSVIALGMFDGVHIGHRELLRFAVRLAEEQEAASVAYTFSNHPRGVFGQAPKLLNTMEERRKAIHALGIGHVHFQHFDVAFAALSPEAFVKYLMNAYSVAAMVAGYNFSFGEGGRGNVDTLQALGEKYAFAVHVLPPVQYEGQAISSTRIRECIEAGDILSANSMLGIPYSFCGVVQKNKHIGTDLGFPTVNLRPAAEKALPQMGVYASAVKWQDGYFPAVTNIGNNPTVEGDHISVETHILDFKEDLYAQEIEVDLYAFLRGEIKFAGKEALARQIGIDVDDARKWLKERGIQPRNGA